MKRLLASALLAISLASSCALAESEPVRLASLSNREMEVLRRLARGENNKNIGTCMNLSAKTISTYRGRIMEKLKTESLVEMVDLAKRNSVQ